MAELLEVNGSGGQALQYALALVGREQGGEWRFLAQVGGGFRVLGHCAQKRRARACDEVGPAGVVAARRRVRGAQLVQSRTRKFQQAWIPDQLMRDGLVQLARAQARRQLEGFVYSPQATRRLGLRLR